MKFTIETTACMSATHHIYYNAVMKDDLGKEIAWSTGETNYEAALNAARHADAMKRESYKDDPTR